MRAKIYVIGNLSKQQLISI